MTRKLTFLILALLALIAGPGWGQTGQTYEKVMELDMTTQAVGCNAYNTTTTYGDWKIKYGANNNKGWKYFKMGGKNTTLATCNPCYIYSTVAATEQIKQIDKITVSIPSGSLSKNGMSVKSWGVYVYSNSNMTDQIDYVAGGTITNNAATFDFYPSDDKTWTSGYYYKVSWDLANTTTTNGIVCVDKITLYKESTPSPDPSITVNPTSIDLGTVNINEEAEATFTVSQANLTNVITLNAENGNLDPESIVAGAGDTEVTYTITPNAAGEFSDVITISCADLENGIEINVSGNAINPSVVETYELYSGSLEEGDYVVYYNGKAMKNTISSNRLDYTEVTPANNVISNPDAAIVWHIAPSGDYWTIYNASVSKYAAGNGTKNQAALSSDGTDDGSLWTVNGTETYDFTNKKNTSSSVNATLRNNGTYGFACYGTGTGAPLSLYKKVNSSTVATPTFTPAGGTYATAQNVTITCATEGASIYYTLDGTTPTNASTRYTSAIAVSETTTVKAIAYVGEESSNVATATYTIVAPLTSITVTGTAADLWKGDAFSHEGITVTANWGDNTQTDVTNDATYSGYDMNTAGEQTVTVTYMEKTASYNVTVQTIANTQATAYTIAQAIAIIDAGKDLNSEVYVAGTISQLDGGNNAPQYHNLTYWIADESSETEFEVYRGRNLGDTDFNTNNDILIGADVIVYGKITKFQSTYEFSQGNYLVSYTAPEVEEYDIILNQNGHGFISADLETASAGQIVTLTATPIANYHFVEWTVLDGDANVIAVNDNNQFVMPASDVEVEATFAEDEVYVITYYYNGELYTDDLAYAGALITLEEDPDMSPVGFSFVGWSTSVASTDVIEGTTYTINADVDFYAVFEKQGTNRGSSNFVKVTTEPEDWSGEYLLVYEGDSYNYAWTGVDAGQCHTDVVISYNVIASQPTDAVTLTLATMDGGYSIRVNGGTNDGKYIGKSSYSNGLDIKEIEQLNTLSMDEYGIIIAAEAVENEVHCTMRYNKSSGNSNERFRYYKSGQEPVQLYKKQGSEPTANRRYTRVYDDVYSFEGGDLTVEGPSIVVSGKTLTVTGTMSNENPANLIIEDGAQLYYTNGETVEATFEKDITGYTGDNDNYYLIANPTDNTTVANLTNNNYDIFIFNPAEASEWKNQHDNAVIEQGTGYLYANSEDVTLQFAGELMPAGETALTLVKAEAGTGLDYPGFNLVGNPFACNAYVGKPFYVIQGTELTLSVNAYVAPCEGFFVEAAEDDLSVTLSTTVPAPANMMSLSVSQNRGNVIDRAIVRFDGANDLHKFMLNPAHTNLSIAKGGETFAAISTEAEGELPVNFHAEKNGTYTITVNTKNVDAEYLHLIDNMTGMDVDLLSTPSYTFEAKTTDYASRFKLVFGVNNTASESSDSNFAFMSDGNLVISDIEGEATLQIIDMMGRVVSTETVSGNFSKALNLRAGAYVLNLNGMTQKIVVE